MCVLIVHVHVMLSVDMNVYNYTHVLLECNEYQLSITVLYFILIIKYQYFIDDIINDFYPLQSNVLYILL